jgi:hypothetical protein
MKELLTFKDFTKRYQLHFFERRKFAKLIDTLGLGWHYAVLWKLESWEYYFLRFRDTTSYENNKKRHIRMDRRK